MMRLSLASLFVIASFGIGQAEQLAVRSGDHPTFSRLTVAVPQTQAWQARQAAQSVELMLPDFNDGFDITDVFSRMQRERISTLEASNGSLVLGLNCDCIATAFRSGELLVIDVADKGTVLAGPPIERFAETAIKDGSLAAKKRALPWIGTASPFQERGLNGSIPEARALPSAEESQIVDRAFLLDQVQNRLSKEVANAASSGILENSLIERQVFEAQDNLNEIKIMPANNNLPEPVQASSFNLRISNSMEITKDADHGALHATPSGLLCPAEDFLTLEAWGDSRSFSAQIGPARDSLMNARDQLDKDAARNLAKLYIHFGFGAEALQALDLDSLLRIENPELVSVAEILEYGSADYPSTLSVFTQCPSNVALWASLSFHTIPADIEIDTNAVLRAVNELPPHLRQIVAPAISDRLLRYGDPDSAAAALRSIERLLEPLNPQAVFAQAALMLDGGNSAEDLLKQVIDTNSARSAEALAKLVESKLTQDNGISDDEVALMQAYSQELRGTEIGNKLDRIQVVAMSQLLRFDEAFDALAVIGPTVSSQIGSDMRNAIIVNLSNKADDITFLEHALEQKESDLKPLPIDTKLLLATRLMDLGFSVQVQQILEFVPYIPQSTSRQILAARAAIQMRQPFQAQAALLAAIIHEAPVLARGAMFEGPLLLDAHR